MVFFPEGKLLAINHGKLNFDETQDYTFSFGQPESKYMVNFAQVMVDQVIFFPFPQTFVQRFISFKK